MWTFVSIVCLRMVALCSLVQVSKPALEAEHRRSLQMSRKPVNSTRTGQVINKVFGNPVDSKVRFQPPDPVARRVKPSAKDRESTAQKLQDNSLKILAWLQHDKTKLQHDEGLQHLTDEQHADFLYKEQEYDGSTVPVHPDAFARMIWDLVMLCCTLLTVILDPLRSLLY